jgi:hypothetical protein
MMAVSEKSTERNTLKKRELFLPGYDFFNDRTEFNKLMHGKPVFLNEMFRVYIQKS